MNKIITLLFATILLTTCKTSTEFLTIDGYTFEEFLAPGVRKISANFYADERELSNIDYKEFMFWTKHIFGETSIEYVKTIPDTTVWDKQKSFDLLPINYFKDPAFNAHPIVGVSLEQAKSYANWRTERVAEMILTSEKLIQSGTKQNRDNYFTIEKYLEGTYEFTLKVKPTLVLPKYTVPTIEEWETISGINSRSELGVDSLDKSNRKTIKDDLPLFNTKEVLIQKIETLSKSEESKIEFIPTTPTSTGYNNVYGLKNMIGNVSELVNKTGASKGGDWFHFLNDTDLNDKPPNSWTGFRNVCRLEVRKKQNGK